MEPKEEKIRVAVRVRPLSTGGEREGEGEAIAASRDGRSVLVYADTSRTSAASFRCGTFLRSTIRQDEVFDEIHAPELVEAALDGFPVTIFAYGQTGAGKSFTIFGKEESSASSRPYGGGAVSETDGILPRAALRLMEIVDARKGVFEYTLRVTCVEIYNEQVRDLFDTKKESLPVRHSKDNGFYLENATVVQCQTAKEIIRVVKLAATNRVKSAHLLNERSNRSHCLVTIYIDSTPCDPTCGAKKYGKLTIVDLAGSERANDTGAVGQQLKETGHINKSLYCLSKVIHAMTTTAKAAGKAKFVPYRDSKLTMLLIDSLGGNSKTLMLACVNAAPQFATESTRTLEFAMGVAKIKNRPTAVLNPHEKLIIDLKEEIRLLKLENLMLRSRTAGYFVEHPEAAAGFDPDGEYEQQTSVSPLGRALLSGRHRPEHVRMTAQQAQYASYGDSHHNNDEPGDERAAANTFRLRTSEKAAIGAGLSGIKKMAAQRRSEQLSKKKKGGILKPKKKKRNVPETDSYFAQNVPDGTTLPPVRQNALLFHKRATEASAGLPVVDKTVYRPRVAVQRPVSPPPEYDDLFGIETVTIGTANINSNQDSHCKLKRSLSALASYSQSQQTPTSPEDQIQRLQRGMAIAPTSGSSTPSAVANNTESVNTSALPPKSRSSGSVVAAQTPQFDDARAEDLFQQLCRL